MVVRSLGVVFDDEMSVLQFRGNFGIGVADGRGWGGVETEKGVWEVRAEIYDL
jgi:hypothetical protein